MYNFSKHAVGDDMEKNRPMSGDDVLRRISGRFSDKIDTKYKNENHKSVKNIKYYLLFYAPLPCITYLIESCTISKPPAFFSLA